MSKYQRSYDHTDTVTDESTEITITPRTAQNIESTEQLNTEVTTKLKALLNTVEEELKVDISPERLNTWSLSNVSFQEDSNVTPSLPIVNIQSPPVLVPISNPVPIPIPAPTQVLNPTPILLQPYPTSSPKSPPKILRFATSIHDFVADANAKYSKPDATSDTPSHSRNDSATDIANMNTAKRVIPKAFRLVSASIIKEKPPYYLATALLGLISSGGWIITSGYNASGIITWITIGAFIYIFQIIQQYLTCGSIGIGHKEQKIMKPKDIILSAQETILVEVIPIGIGNEPTNIVDFPEYANVFIYDKTEKTYARITNLYRWHKITIQLDPIYNHPLKDFL